MAVSARWHRVSVSDPVRVSAQEALLLRAECLAALSTYSEVEGSP